MNHNPIKVRFSTAISIACKHSLLSVDLNHDVLFNEGNNVELQSNYNYKT